MLKSCDYLLDFQALAAQGGPTGGQFRASPTVAAALDAAAASTLTQDFHTRLDNLLRTLVHARPHFVRCLRANATETPMLFERATVARQVSTRLSPTDCQFFRVPYR